MEDVEPVGEIEAVVGDADVTTADLEQVVTRLPGFQHPWLAPAVVAGAGLLSLSFAWPALDRRTVLTVLLPLLFALVLMVFVRRAARRAWIQQALANVGGQTTFRFDGYGFTSESSLRQHRLAWASLARAAETPHAFLVYTTPRTVLIVPKRAFASEDVAALSRLLLERITPKPLPKARLLVGLPRTLLLWVLLVVSFLAIWHFLDESAPPAPRQHGRRESTPHSVTAPTRDGEASDVDSSP